MTDSITVRDGGYEYEIMVHRSAEEFDIARLEAMWADRTLLTLQQVGEMCGVSDKGQLAHWKRAMENYLFRGHTEWPPNQRLVRTVVGEIVSEEPLLDELPPYESVLPAPATYGGRWSGQDRWYRGDIYKWGMRTRRIDHHGNPLTGTERTAGRHPALFKRKLARRRRITD